MADEGTEHRVMHDIPNGEIDKSETNQATSTVSTTFWNLPVELRLKIYRYAFRPTVETPTTEEDEAVVQDNGPVDLVYKPVVLVNIALTYDLYAGRRTVITKAETTHAGNQLLHTCKTIYNEAVEEYWKYATVAVAKLASAEYLHRTVAGRADTSTRSSPLPVSLQLLTKGLPDLALRNIPHLRNIRLPPLRVWRGAIYHRTNLPMESQATALLAKFPRLQTITFAAEARTSLICPRRNEDQIVQTETHFPFWICANLLGGPIVEPKIWMKEHYALDVDDLDTVGNIHFFGRSAEKRTPEQAEELAFDAGISDVDELPAPVDVYLNFSRGLYYGKKPLDHKKPAEGEPSHEQRVFLNDQNIWNTLQNWEPPVEEPEEPKEASYDAEEMSVDAEDSYHANDEDE